MLIAMKLIIKLSPEIMIKSQSVRLRFIKILTSNIRNLLHQTDELLAITRHWDRIEVRAINVQLYSQMAEILTRIPGIHHLLLVEERTFKDIHDIYEQTLAMYYEQLVGKSFCVSVKRRGEHDFTSQDVEHYLGRGLKHNVENTYVKLVNPDKVVLLEIADDHLLFINKRYEGLGGFPIGTQGEVLSLISGGFDSSVASYMLIRRGYKVSYCFFNLGDANHEIGVRKVAYHLWNRFGHSHKVHFISINFTPVVHEIIKKVDDSQMGVILKRMMIRAASIISEYYGIQALVTGEALGQVSSQTLTNMQLIDNASNIIILRPLISHDKEHIIKLARYIGTEIFTKHTPEYCGLISKKPTVRASQRRLEQEESNFNFEILHAVVAQAQMLDIRKIINHASQQVIAVEIITELGSEDIVLDIRTQDEQEANPLCLSTNVVVKTLPFYKLAKQFRDLDQSKFYLLYCDRGVMSQVQAQYLRGQGFQNVKVYRP